MAALEIPGNGDTGNHISEEHILKTLDTLEDPLQKVRRFAESYRQRRFIISVGSLVCWRPHSVIIKMCKSFISMLLERKNDRLLLRLVSVVECDASDVYLSNKLSTSQTIVEIACSRSPVTQAT